MVARLRASIADPYELADGCIHLFIIDLDDEALALLARGSLSAEETAASLMIAGGQERCAQDRRGRDRRLVARGHLRRILGHYAGSDPKTLPIARDHLGKPYLATAFERGRLTFNLAHTGSVLLVGIARDLDIGVDAEEVRPIANVIAMAAQTFSMVEVGELGALDPSLRERAFYACWTRKEAFVKATGAGLAGDFRSFDVSLRPNEPARVTGFRGRWAHFRTREWQMRAFEPAGSIVAACAARCATLRCRWMPLTTGRCGSAAWRC